MTLGELLHHLDKPSHRLICQAVLYYLEAYEGKSSATVAQIKAALKKAGRRKQANANLYVAIGESSPLVQVVGSEGRANLWALTGTGRREIAELLPEEVQRKAPVHDARNLRELLKSLDAAVGAYIEEAITCLEANALRAAIVFLWAGAVRTIQDRVVVSNKKNLDASAAKRAPKAPKIRSVDQLCYVKESSLLLISEDLSLFDRNERGVLEQCLDLRNKCGHPGKYRPGLNKVRSFIEDVTSVVFGDD